MSELIEYKCPCCGGRIEFNASLQKMKCPYCDTEFDLDTLKEYDEQLSSDSADEMSWESEQGSVWNGEEEGVSVFVCESCGGQIVCEETTAASSCPYCSNPVVMKGRLSGDLKPDYVIPFKLDKEAAKKGLIKHVKSKKLAPKAFKDENHIDEIKGVYVPFWLFDTDADAKIRYRATRVRSWSDSRYRYTETSHYSVYRAGDISFLNVPADGSSKLDDTLTEAIEPFDFSDAVDFQTAYLSGFLADRYDVKAESCSDRVNERIKTSTLSYFSSTVLGYTSLIPENVAISLKNGRIKYVLYPVWLLNTSWKGKRYYFAMNGQTGKFVGDLPLDIKAFFIWLLSIFGAVSALALAIMLIAYLL